MSSEYHKFPVCLTIPLGVRIPNKIEGTDI